MLGMAGCWVLFVLLLLGATKKTKRERLHHAVWGPVDHGLRDFTETHLLGEGRCFFFWRGATHQTRLFRGCHEIVPVVGASRRTTANNGSSAERFGRSLQMKCLHAKMEIPRIEAASQPQRIYILKPRTPRLRDGGPSMNQPSSLGRIGTDDAISTGIQSQTRPVAGSQTTPLPVIFLGSRQLDAQRFAAQLKPTFQSLHSPKLCTSRPPWPCSEKRAHANPCQHGERTEV